MPEFPLTLRPRTAAPRPVSAWYLSGGPDDWLAEIAEWPTAHSAIRIVPVSGGALVTPKSADFPTSRRCLPHARLAGRLYIPTDADLDPPITETELSELLGDHVYVWHPGGGLIAADEGDLLTVADLFGPATVSDRRWDRAVPGIALTDRLVLMPPPMTIEVRDVIDQGRGDIGADAGEPAKLPESPTEPGKGAFQGVTRAVALGAMRAVRGITRLFPATAGSPTWIDRIEQYFTERIERITRAIEESRNRELGRLMNLLENDPDRGLRFALPLGGDSHRGTAPPSDRLSERKVDFRLGGGGPGDAWDVPAEYQRRLLEKYRELANREIHLGRHRRAAYIFAELLGDCAAAASALSSGHHYREAAVLYRDRLGKPQEAARCLEHGGLWAEAIEHYEVLGMFEKVGDLYDVLGRPEQAIEAYRTAAERHRMRGDLIEAARVCERKLSDPAGAVELLESGWPHSPQAMACTRAEFELFGRLDRHGAALERAADLAEDTGRHGMHSSVSELLAELATDYPDRSVRDLAAEQARRVIACRLRDASESEASRLVASLTKLAPQDKLLARDGRRFVSGQRVPVQPLRPDRSGKRVRQVCEFDMQLPLEWQTAAIRGKVIYIAGLLDKRIVVARCDFKGHYDWQMPWPKQAVRTDCPIVLATGESGRGLGVFAIGELGPVADSPPCFRTTDEFDAAVIQGALASVPAPWGVTRAPHGDTWALSFQEDLVLSVENRAGDLLATHPIGLPHRPTSSLLPVPMHARGDCIYLGMGNELVIFRGRKGEQRIEFSSRIVAITGSVPTTRNRIGVALEDGAAVVWDNGDRVTALTDAGREPAIGFLRSGFLGVASGEDLNVYLCRRGEVKHVGSAELTEEAIAVLPAPMSDQLAVVTRRGKVLVFEL